MKGFSQKPQSENEETINLLSKKLKEFHLYLTKGEEKTIDEQDLFKATPPHNLSLFSKNTSSTNITENFQTRWKRILAQHKVSNLLETVKCKLHATGTVFDEETLRKINNHFLHNNDKKLKRNDKIFYSVVKDQKEILYAIIHTGVIHHSLPGKVCLVQNLLTKELAIVKIYKLISSNYEAQFLEDRNLLLGQQSLPSFAGTKKIYLFMKLLPGVTLRDFYSLIKKNNETLTKEEQAQFLLSVLRGLHSIVMNNIFHSDLHHENILIDPLTWQSNIIDFGAASSITSLSFERREDRHHHDINRLLSNHAIKGIVTDPELQKIIRQLKRNQENVAGYLLLCMENIARIKNANNFITESTKKVAKL